MSFGIAPSYRPISLGWEVQKMHQGNWIKASPVVQNEGLAELLLDETFSHEIEMSEDWLHIPFYRLFEHINFPVTL